MDLKKLAMGASLSVAFIMLIGKLTAYFITGSSAILSDAAESVVHIAATGVASASLWYAYRAPDDSHPYGHGKIAYFSAGFEGAMIFSAAAYIYYSAIHSLLVGPQLNHLGTGVIITALLCLVNLALGLFLVYAGKKHNAVILIANGKHVLTDMWTSAGVVIGVLIVNATGILWFDPLCAILVATNIVFEAVRLMRRAFDGLLDQANPQHAVKITEALQQAMNEGRISGFHQLKHREANDVIWVDIHMLVPGNLTTMQAHKAVTEVEKSIASHFDKYTVHVTTHIEPEEHDKAHPEGHPNLPDPYAIPPK